MSTETFFEESTEQSRIKATIVRKYFWAWAKVILPSVKKRDGRIAYIDLFSGPGRYRDGTKSTPLLVLETAIADPEMRGRLVTILNDADKRNVAELKTQIDNLPGIEKLRYKPQIGAEEVGDQIVAMFKRVKLVPTLFFADPWGYKGLSLDLIGGVMKNWGTDCIFFFNYNRVNMGLDNDSVDRCINVLFGKERAERLRVRLAGLPPHDRESAIVDTLAESLKQLRIEYVHRFTFKDGHGTRTSHHLVFATKHPRGYGIMKDIMAKYSSEEHQGVPSFGYRPAETIHPTLFELDRPLDDLEGMLLDKFAGQTITTLEIYNRHHVGRRYLMKNYKAVLISLEGRGIVKADPPAAERPKDTFADRVKVTFPRNGGKT